MDRSFLEITPLEFAEIARLVEAHRNVVEYVVSLPPGLLEQHKNPRYCADEIQAFMFRNEKIHWIKKEPLPNGSPYVWLTYRRNDRHRIMDGFTLEEEDRDIEIRQPIDWMNVVFGLRQNIAKWDDQATSLIPLVHSGLETVTLGRYFGVICRNRIFCGSLPMYDRTKLQFLKRNNREIQIDLFSAGYIKPIFSVKVGAHKGEVGSIVEYDPFSHLLTIFTRDEDSGECHKLTYDITTLEHIRCRTLKSIFALEICDYIRDFLIPNAKDSVFWKEFQTQNIQAQRLE